MVSRIPVLDKGYVELVDHMGSDLSPSNAARASFAKRHSEFTEADRKLLKFLIREQHTSPFRHAMLQFEVKAPLMVARQWWKYCVGSDHTMDGWNEASRRYITMEPEFYIPTEWRSVPENKKQGSGDPIPDEEAGIATIKLENVINDGMRQYEWALENGICPEQARGYLPAYFMYTNWWWTASLQAVAHFLAQRLADDAQKEIQAYAHGILKLVKPLFPESLEGFVST